jgi:hypothetical protein
MINTYVHIYMYTHTHTHTYIYRYIVYIYTVNTAAHACSTSSALSAVFLASVEALPPSALLQIRLTALPKSAKKESEERDLCKRASVNFMGSIPRV